MVAEGRWLAAVVLGVAAWCSHAAGGEATKAAPVPSAAAASETRLKRDVTFLASPECEGRGPTTAGLRRAGDYVADQMRKAGLKPGASGGGYFQPFTIPAAVLDAPATLSLAGPGGRKVEMKQGEQFWPMGLGAAGKDAGRGVVFAGYGITSDRAGYDDYDGLDVADKVVVVLRGSPRPADRQKLRALADGAPFLTKLANAERHNASAVLVVNDRETARDGDGLLDFNYTALDRTGAHLPAFHVHRSVLEAMFPGGAKGLAAAEDAIDHDLKPQGRELEGWKASFEVRMRRDRVTLRNVVGVLEGSGPLARETVVVGAHYDHLGYGGRSSMAGLKKMAMHPGADDNGSGTSALLELARRFGAHRGREGRRLVFLAFSGEELGLFGSDHYCKHPLFSLDDTAAMYNLDMVGRLRPDNDTGQDKLLTEGSGTAKAFLPLLERLADRYNLKMVNKPGGFGPSDHASFCGKHVPVLFVWTGYHDDYHKPGDTADKINVSGMRKVVDLSEEIIDVLATMDRPEFITVRGSHPSGGPSPGMPRLGIRPDYADDGEGVLLGGVTDGQPAARAGLKAGDRIVELAGKPVKSLETYMEILSGQKKGDTIDVVVVRGGKRVTLKVQLE
jgi:hypothetical protein